MQGFRFYVTAATLLCQQLPDTFYFISILMALTDEQRRRIEENRRRAQARLLERRSK